MQTGKRRDAHPSKHLLAVFVAAALGVAGLALVGLIVVGSSGRDRMSADSRVAGVDVGGMTPAQARAALRRRFDGLLARPVLVRHGQTRFVLVPRRSGVRADVDTMVGRAFAESRSGDALGRGVRRLLGLASPIREPLRVVYSGQAIAAFAKRISRRIGPYRAPRGRRLHAPRAAADAGS